MKKYLFAVLLLLVSITTFAQAEGINGISVEVLETIRNVEPEVKPVVQRNNQVFIRQIGTLNFTDARVTAEASELNFLQKGNQNYIGLVADVKTINATVIQNGDHNKHFDFINAPAEEVDFHLTQNGNFGHFESYGTNSIGNNLQFETNGDFKTIIVRNFR